MNHRFLRLVFASALAALFVTPAAFGQRQLGKKRAPMSKIYVADATGEGQIQNGDKIYTSRQASAYDAPGTIIETKANAHNTIVYSNGTGMFVDENTRVEIDRFTQEPFQPAKEGTLDTPFEPSMSQSNVHVPHGAIGICTNQLLSGSSMLYSTPHAGINIRGGRVSIEAHAGETYVDLLEGDITVRSSGKDVGGQVLRPGERAIIRPPAGPGLEASIEIQQIPQEARKIADDRVELACNAKKSVTFEVISRPTDENGSGSEPAGEAAGAGDPDQEIVAKPTVPANPPTNMVISPHSLPKN